MSNVKISVVVPMYNKEEYIGRCINSILHQTLQPYEVIIVNDGSTDASLEILQQYTNVKIINQVNAGVSAARNAGIACTKGTHIAFLDADDEWMPTFLKEIYSFRMPDCTQHLTPYQKK